MYSSSLIKHCESILPTMQLNSSRLDSFIHARPSFIENPLVFFSRSGCSSLDYVARWWIHRTKKWYEKKKKLLYHQNRGYWVQIQSNLPSRRSPPLCVCARCVDVCERDQITAEHVRLLLKGVLGSIKTSASLWKLKPFHSDGFIPSLRAHTPPERSS